MGVVVARIAHRLAAWLAKKSAPARGRKASDIYENLRLDYVDDKTGKLNEMTGGYLTVEFDYVAPNKGTFKRAYDLNSGYPYTNTGMISSKRTIIPEFVYSNWEQLATGTVLKKFDKDGSLIGIWELKNDITNNQLFNFIKK